MSRRTMMTAFMTMAAAALLAASWVSPARAEQPEAAPETGEVGHAEAHGAETPPPINWAGGHAATEGEAEGEEAPPPFVFMLLNFGVLLALFGWKAAPALRRHVAARHTLIREALDDAARIRQEAQEKLDTYSKRIANVDAEVDELVAGIREEAEAEKQRIIADAERQAAAMKQSAEDRIAAELTRARDALEREVVVAAVAAAEKILREKATSTDKSQLVDGFITGLESQSKPTPPERTS
jgi:F-type H+-transporting ATPase subunit b